MPLESDYERYKLNTTEPIKDYYDTKTLFEKRLADQNKIYISQHTKYHNPTVMNQHPERKSIMDHIVKEIAQIKAIGQATQELLLELAGKIESSMRPTPKESGWRETAREKIQGLHEQNREEKREKIKKYFQENPGSQITLNQLSKILHIPFGALKKHMNELCIPYTLHPSNKYNTKQKQQVIELFQRGEPLESITYKLNVKYSTAKTWIKAFKKEKANASDAV